MSAVDFCHIVCMTPQGIIGQDGSMPWHIPEDLKRFKQITMGSPMVMGRKTWESLPSVLEGRDHIVVSRHPPPTTHPQLQWYRDLNEATQIAADLSTTSQVFIIGGAQIYQQTLSLVHKIYVTMIHVDIPGDVKYPIHHLSSFKIHTKQSVSLKWVSQSSAYMIKAHFIEYHKHTSSPPFLF